MNYTYTTDGKISSVTDSTGTTMFTYDLMDGLTRVDYPDGNYVSYSYDDACRLTSVTTPFGSTSYEYDKLDRIVRVVDRNGYATIYEYDANGSRTAVHYANGLTTTYDYDLLNRLIRQETIDNSGNVVVQYIYTLGVAGERLSVNELDRTVEYTYDSLYRLTSETITDENGTTVYTYAYDNVSNRTLKTENGAETAYVYNSLNQLVSDSDTSYEYDLNGNLVRVIGTDKSALYEYNAENKLVKATVQNGNLVTVETYTYDYAGNRTSKTTTSSNGSVEYVKYLNDNSALTNVLAEIGSDGSVQAYYTIGADLISQERNGVVYTYLYDGHGSVVGMTDESGRVTDTYVYDAFGNLIDSTGSTKNYYRYCGEQFDETTGLYYLRARYMDTTTGRFISQDSYAGSISDPTSLHKYLYANANPVMYSDPSGYMPGIKQIECMLIVSAVYCVATQVALNILHDFYNSTTIDILDGLENINDHLMDWVQGVSYGYAINLDEIRDEILENVEIQKRKYVVGAMFEVNGHVYYDVNPTARVNIVSEEIILDLPAGEKGTTIVNRNTATCHAEIGAMYKAVRNGELGGDGVLYVVGKPICFFCRVDVKKLALALKLDTLTVYDETGKYEFNGFTNDFFPRYKGGKSWAEAYSSE